MSSPGLLWVIDACNYYLNHNCINVKGGGAPLFASDPLFLINVCEIRILTADQAPRNDISALNPCCNPEEQPAFWLEYSKANVTSGTQSQAGIAIFFSNVSRTPGR